MDKNHSLCLFQKILKINPRRNTPRHILIKLTKIKDKEKILKAAREEKQIAYKGTPMRLSADFSAETLQARREWHDILNVMKGKKPQPRLLYPAWLSFRFEGEKREKGTEKIFQETIAENLPNMGKESLTQIQEAQRLPYKINPRRNTPGTY